MLVAMPAGERKAFVVSAATAVALALMISAPLIHDQMTSTSLRGEGSPVIITPLPVLGSAFGSLRRILDVPAFWLVQLPVEFPAFSVTGAVVLVWLWRRQTGGGTMRLAVLVLASLTFGSLLVASLAASKIADNNDLGWRAVLPAILLLIAFAAAGLARWSATKRRWAFAAALCGVLLGLPDGILTMRSNAFAEPSVSGKIFAATSGMWEAVRRHTAPSERIGNNPLFMADMTSWPVNISWALLSNRRSCYAGTELALPFAPLSVADRQSADALFLRVFAGQAQAGDVQQLASRFDCHTTVVTSQDGAWGADPFAADNSGYRLAETDHASWRIYRIDRQTR